MKAPEQYDPSKPSNTNGIPSSSRQQSNKSPAIPAGTPTITQNQKRTAQAENKPFQWQFLLPKYWGIWLLFLVMLWCTEAVSDRFRQFKIMEFSFRKMGQKVIFFHTPIDLYTKRSIHQELIHQGSIHQQVGWSFLAKIAVFLFFETKKIQNQS